MKTKKYFVSVLVVLSSLLVVTLSSGATRSHRRQERRDRREERRGERRERREERNERRQERRDSRQNNVLNYVRGEILVQFTEEVHEDFKSRIGINSPQAELIAALRDICSGIFNICDIEQIEPVFNPESGEDIEDLNRIYKLKLGLGTSRTGSLADMLEVCRELSLSGEFVYAEPNYIYTSSEYSNSSGGVSNDSDSDKQWGLRTINADGAWDYSQGKGILVAVIDSGVNLDHSDLESNIRGEKSFVSASADDNDGHGTHCAGIISAIKDNGIGIAGVAPKAYIMPIKVFRDGEATTDNVVRGIYYAKEKGAKVISCSFGGPKSLTMRSAVLYAYRQGCIIVAAAGNIQLGSSPRSTSYHPASIPGVLTVAAINRYGDRASFSCFGRCVDVAAPGVDIYSTINGDDDRYGYKSGTSMACPHVAGLAALIWSAKPDLTNRQVIRIIKQTATDIDTYGWDIKTGYGLINAERAVREAIR